MFTHRVRIQLKPDSFIELSRKIQQEIMPALRLQKGFCRGVTSIDTQWLTATEETFWKTKEDAENYHLTGYPAIRKIISGIIAAEPVASIYENPDSAFDQNGKPSSN
jgi:hypothetical protein